MQEALLVPFSVLLDLVAIQQIKEEGAERKLTEEDETDEMLRLLDYE